MKKLILILFTLCFFQPIHAQDFGDFPKVPQEELQRDLDLLYQGLDSFHTGMYWYSTYDDVRSAFDAAKREIDRDLNVLEFFKIVAPLVSLSREDHTDMSFSNGTREAIAKEATFFPFTVVFLGTDLYIWKNGSDEDAVIEGRKVLSINGETPVEIAKKLGTLFASDGYNEAVKYSDLRRFRFARNFYYYYGNLSSFEVEFEDETIVFSPVNLTQLNQNFAARYGKEPQRQTTKESLEFQVIDDSIAYLGLHSFSNDSYAENETNKNFPRFLQNSFAEIEQKNIETLIIDISKNGGGDEGNGNLLFSYIGDNFQKYKRVSAKTQTAILDNGVDKPVELKTFGFFERVFLNKKMEDGSYERREGRGHGLMAYKKGPKHKYSGDIYVLISPITYSGASELSNMIYTNDRAIFVGQETGGGYYGNTSGYTQDLTLPNSKITVEIPALKFEANVKDVIPFGRGVIPHHQVIPSFEQYISGKNEALEFTLNLIREKE
ncbi:MAG: S41 family peptidase [Hellea sp.]